MTNKEALKEDIENIFYGTPTDKENGTCIEPNDRVVGELMELQKQEAIAFLQWLIKEEYEVHSKDAFMKIDNNGFDDVGIAKILSATQLYDLYTKEQSLNTTN